VLITPRTSRRPSGYEVKMTTLSCRVELEISVGGAARDLTGQSKQRGDPQVFQSACESPATVKLENRKEMLFVSYSILDPCLCNEPHVLLPYMPLSSLIGSQLGPQSSSRNELGVTSVLQRREAEACTKVRLRVLCKLKTSV